MILIIYVEKRINISSSTAFSAPFLTLKPKNLSKMLKTQLKMLKYRILISFYIIVE